MSKNHTPEHREYLRQKMIARNTKHGLASRANRPVEYQVWKQMRQRCNNRNAKKWAIYGARGITVDPRWNDFSVFFSDMGPRPSSTHQLEREDNFGPYSPENCRWATPLEQGQNKRNNHLLTLDGKTLTISEWSRISGSHASRILWRIRKGWDVREAIFLRAVKGRNQYATPNS